MHGSHPHDPRLIGKGPGGVYSWSKEDDMRLTEIMKKYKNPRDWEPIAKEFGEARPLRNVTSDGFVTLNQVCEKVSGKIMKTQSLWRP